MRAIFLSFVKQKSLLKSRLERSENVENWITIYVCMRPTSGILTAILVVCLLSHTTPIIAEQFSTLAFLQLLFEAQKVTFFPLSSGKNIN